MKARELMVANPVCCTPEDTIEEAAELMAAHHCGVIPVVGSLLGKRLVGIITDRDVTCRAVALSLDPANTPVGACMTEPVVTVGPESTLETVCELMADRGYRRIPVVNSFGQCEGIISQVDILRCGPALVSADQLRAISHPHHVRAA